jgi:hypothetical protein
MKAQTTVFLSMMATIFFITKVIPLNIGEPLYVFFGVLFSYFTGSICIVFIYILNTLDLIINIPSIIAIAESSKSAMASLTSGTAPVLPEIFFAITFAAGTYFAVTMGIFACKALIRKLHLVDKFGGVYV